MKQQQIKFGKNGREKLLNGVELVTKGVKTTLGPGGRNAVFQVGNSTVVTKDGVSVCKQIKSNDPFENMGISLVRQASEKTAFSAGDGTTSSLVLAEAIIKEGCTMLASGLNAISLQRGINSAAKTIVNYIRENLVQECTEERIKHVALVSTNWDEELANLISEAIIKVGKNGSVTINDSHSAESTIRYIDGLQIERGYMSPYFISDTAKQVCVFENPLILLSAKKITNNLQLKPILETALNYGRGRPLLIIAPDIEQEAMTTLVVNKLRGSLNICAIKCPGFGDRQTEQMEDLQSLLGGTYFTDLLARDFTTINPQVDYASCEKVIITRDNTTFIHGAGDPDALQARINYLNERLLNKPESWEARLISERIAKLSDGVAVIEIGANTESELKERRDRADDAICAARAAFEEGIVPGGGVALAKLKNRTLKFEKGDHSFNIGVQIVRNALVSPLKQLLINAGVDNPDIIIEKIIKKVDNIGFDIKTEKFVDMIETGIIDPFKVTRCVLENAASVAGLILTTECFISEDEEEQKEF